VKELHVGLSLHSLPLPAGGFSLLDGVSEEEGEEGKREESMGKWVGDVSRTSATYAEKTRESSKVVGSVERSREGGLDQLFAVRERGGDEKGGEKEERGERGEREEKGVSKEGKVGGYASGWLFLLSPLHLPTSIDALNAEGCVGVVRAMSDSVVMARQCSDECREVVMGKGIVKGSVRIPNSMLARASLLSSSSSNAGEVGDSREGEGEKGENARGTRKGARRSESAQYGGGKKEVEKTGKEIQLIVALEKGEREEEVVADLKRRYERIEKGEIEVRKAGSGRVRVVFDEGEVEVEDAVSIILENGGVIYVEEETKVRTTDLHSARVTAGASSSLPNSTLLWEIGLNGTGQVVAVGDTGIDLNHCFFFDPAHPNITANEGFNTYHRKIAAFFTFGETNAGIDPPGGHGSHVAGIVAGNPKFEGSETAAQRDAMMEGVGVAPDARLAIIDLQGGGEDPSDLTVPANLEEDYYPLMYNITMESVISCNSWAGEGNYYTLGAMDTDFFAYSHPSFLPVFAAGNSGEQGDRTVQPPSTCKSCISVGSTLPSPDGFASTYADTLTGSFGGITGLYVLDVEQGNHTVFNASRTYQSKQGYSRPVHGKLAVAEPIEACSPLTSLHNGSIVIVRRGSCTFATKATNVEDAGGIGMVIVDSAYSARRPPLYSASSNIVAVAVERSDGESVMQLLQSRQLNGTLPFTIDYFSEYTMSPFSGRGPTAEGMAKPEVVSVGSYVLSAKSDGSQSDPHSCTPVSSLLSLSGTSMATPNVAGTVALIRQFYREGYLNPGSPSTTTTGFYPSGALVKATLLATTVPARNRAGDVGSKSEPFFDMVSIGYGNTHANRSARGDRTEDQSKNAQGYGVVKAGDALHKAFMTGKGLYIVEYTPISHGSILYLCFDTDPAVARPRVRLSLVWYDVPAIPGWKELLVNDLDLVVVTSNGDTYFGNGGRQRDSINTAEVVDIAVNGPTSFVVYVYGRSVSTTQQRFALVVSGDVDVTTGCTRTCPQQCSQRGTCSSGVCQCESGYTGVACQVAVTPIQLADGSLEGVDVVVWPGEWTFFSIDVASVQLPTASHFLSLWYSRLSSGGDPDYYIHTSIPTSFTYTTAAVGCDYCVNASTAGMFNISAFASTSTVYLGVFGSGTVKSEVKILLVDSTVDVCSAIDCTQLRNASTTCTGSNCNAAMPVFRTEYAVIIIFVVIVIGVAIVIIVVQYGKLQNEKKRLRRVLDHSSNGTGSSARRSGRVVPVPHEAAPVPLDATATRASP